MKKIGKKYKEIIFAVTAAVILTGCVSKEQYYEDITLSRQQAYQQWQSRKKAQKMAQTLINGELSLQDCIKLTIVNNKMLQSIVQEKEVARGEELRSYSAILPSLMLTYDYMRKDKVASLGPITFGDVDNYSAGLRVSQPIFDGGSMIARMNSARLFSLMTDETVRSTVQDILYLAIHAYHDVLLDQHLLEISQDAVRSSQAHLDNVRTKRKGGVASDFDVLRAEVELSNFEAELIQNKNTINVAKANLLKIMGVSQDSEVSLTDELVYVPEDISMEQAVETAFNNRPDLLSGELDIKYQKEQLNIARSQYWPAVSGFYERSFSKPDPHNGTLIDWGYIWNAGVSVSFPVFDGFAREGSVIQQKARFKQAQINLVDAEETTLFEITKALLSIHDAEEFVHSQRLNLTRAEEGLRLAEVGYKEGTNTQVEMIDAQSALTEAMANYYQSIYTHIISKLDLQKSMGTLAVPYDAEQPGVSAQDSDVVLNIQ